VSKGAFGTRLAAEADVRATDVLAGDSPRASSARPITVRRPGGGPGPAEALKTLIDHRDLFWTLTRHRIRVRYKQSVLGLAWAVVQPVALMLIFTLAFSRIARVSSEGIAYPLFAYSGLLMWSFLSTGLSNITHSVVANAQLITKVYFPREILPLTYLAAALFDWCIGAVVLGALLAYYDHVLTWNALYALPILVLLAGLVTGVGLLLAALQVPFRDVGIAIPLAIYLWLFSTPIAYPLSAVPETYRSWFLLNPMTGIVESFRDAVIRGAAPDPRVLVVPVLMTIVLVPLGYIFFKRTERTMADVI
jgi:lipopolysaccharide transport system permease protein